MKIQQIMEVPIEDYQLIGDFNRGHSFRHSADRRLVSNPRYIERIKSMFSKVPVDIRMFMINSKEASIGYAAGRAPDEYPKREPFVELGEVSMEWLQKNMPQGLAQIQQQGGFNPEGINIIYTNNAGAERRPMTGWIMAHRLGHAILRSGGQGNSPLMICIKDLETKIKEILKLYGQRVPQYQQRSQNQEYQGGYRSYQTPPNYDAAMVKTLLARIGTFKSARENNLRTFAEFVYECFAQYLLVGAIRFNPAPRSLITGYAWGRPQNSRGLTPEAQEDADYAISYIDDAFTQEFEIALHGSVGKVYVM